MVSHPCRPVLPALLFVWLGLAGPARAVFPPPVKDDAKLFSPETLEKANKKIRALYGESRKDVVIETYLTIPADLEKKYKELGKAKFFAEWAAQRVNDLGVNGVYILICKDPAHLQIAVDEQTRKKAFSLADRDKLARKMLEQFRDKKFDAGLLEGIDFIGSTLKANLGK